MSGSHAEEHSVNQAFEVALMRANTGITRPPAAFPVAVKIPYARAAASTLALEILAATLVRAEVAFAWVGGVMGNTWRAVAWPVCSRLCIRRSARK